MYIQNVAKLGAYANWMLGDWGAMSTYIGGTSPLTYDGAFLRAVLDAHHTRLDEAEAHIEAAYRVLGWLLSFWHALTVGKKSNYVWGWNRRCCVDHGERVVFSRLCAHCARSGIPF